MNKLFIQKYFDNDILNIKKITGGISNYVYLVETKKNILKRLLKWLNNYTQLKFFHF